MEPSRLEPGLYEYPLLRFFAYGEEVLIYDARPHFAFLLSRLETHLLTLLLEEMPKERIAASHEGSVYGKAALESLLRKFEELKAAGVFAKGPAAAVAPCGKKDLTELIAYYDENILLRKFCLEVTQNCNYACRYCKRTLAAAEGKASALDMSEQVAQAGLHYYFKKYTSFYKRLDEVKKKLLLEAVPPTLSWYGGEPFLNFSLIRKTADCFRNLPWEEFGISPSCLAFTANTNLSVMNGEIMAFLAENNVTLFASLDGPREEHDKCRVFPSGAGTFDLACQNLLRLKAAYPEYFGTKVTIFSVHTSDHDYASCVEFVRGLGVFSHKCFPVDYAGSFVYNLTAETAFYSKALAEGLPAFEVSAAKADADAGADLNLFAHVFPFTQMHFDHPRGREKLNLMLSCPMAFDNLMLTATGDYVICHKVDGSMPVGDWQSGLDFGRVLSLYQRYNAAINNFRCKSCWNVQFCGVCAAARLVGGTFVNPTAEECDYFRLRTAYDFNCFIMLARKHPSLLKRIFDFRNDRKKYIGVIDINDF